MSERKVISKYYPPDFNPATIDRRHRRPQQSGHKLPPARVMAPFSMKCNSCGEYISKGRKFNARKEQTDIKYYDMPNFRLYIRCPRCATEITYRTDYKNGDYECESGATRPDHFEPWRNAKLAEETDEERLDRLEGEEVERDPIKDFEAKVLDEKTNMAVADALDEIRGRNARRERMEKEGNVEGPEVVETMAAELQRKKEDADDTEIARQAFKKRKYEEDEGEIKKVEKSEGTSDWAIRARKKKKKSDLIAKLCRARDPNEEA